MREKGEKGVPSKLYIEGEDEGSTLAQNTRRNVSHWIGISLLDAGDIKPPGVINDAS